MPFNVMELARAERADFAGLLEGLTPEQSEADMDWSAGRGPEVSGSAEALLMAVAGRHGVTDELSGDGQPTLAKRLTRS